MGTHNWHIVPSLESASFKKRYVLSNSQLQLQLLSHSKPQLQLQLLKNVVINYISIKLQLQLLQACNQLPWLACYLYRGCARAVTNYTEELGDGITDFFSYLFLLIFCRLIALAFDLLDFILLRFICFFSNYCVELSNARINRLSNDVFPSTSCRWNSRPSSVFPASFNLPSFKTQVYHHLRDQMHDFFLLPFLHILQICFILITFFFHFLKDTDSRKGTLCPFCVSTQKKNVL